MDAGAMNCLPDRIEEIEELSDDLCCESDSVSDTSSEASNGKSKVQEVKKT